MLQNISSVSDQEKKKKKKTKDIYQQHWLQEGLYSLCGTKAFSEW